MASIKESTVTPQIESTFQTATEPVSTITGPGAEPTFPTRSRFLTSPLPIISTYQPDALRQFYRGGVPQQRIFPRNG